MKYSFACNIEAWSWINLIHQKRWEEIFWTFPKTSLWLAYEIYIIHYTWNYIACSTIFRFTWSTTVVTKKKRTLSIFSLTDRQMKMFHLFLLGLSQVSVRCVNAKSIKSLVISWTSRFFLMSNVDKNKLIQLNKQSNKEW